MSLAPARAVVAGIRDREVTFMAAAVAYYMLVSLVPLLVLVAVAAVELGGEPLRAGIEASVTRRLPSAGEYVQTALRDRAGAGGLGTVSLLVTAWGSLRLFRGVDAAFSSIYGSHRGNLLDQLRDAVTAAVSIGAGVFGVAALATAVAAVDAPLAALAAPVLLFGALCAGFLPFYYVFPDVDVSVREVLPGTVTAAVGFTLLGSVFGVYAALTAGIAGALGAVLLLVTYFYAAALLLLVGAVVNAVLAGRLANRQLQHDGTRGE